jgi:hypothetical membrane protein
MLRSTRIRVRVVPTTDSVKGLFSLEKARDLRVAGVLYTLAGTVTLLATTLSEALYPNYSVRSNTISDLAAIGAPTSLVEGPEGIFRMLCFFAGAYFLFRGTRIKGATTIFGLLGVGSALATLSPENYNVAVHSLGAIITFFSAVVAMAFSIRMVGSLFRYFAASFVIVSTVGIFVLFLGYGSPLVQQTLGPGGWERVIAYPFIIWLIGFGNYLLTAKSNEGPQ